MQANRVGVGEDGSNARMVGAAGELDHGDGVADEGFNDTGVKVFCAFAGISVGGLCNIKKQVGAAVEKQVADGNVAGGERGFAGGESLG